jgi:hypothetical protein
LRDGIGYNMRLIVPFTAVRLEPGLTEFLFDMAVNATFALGQGLARLNLFGACAAYASTLGYGRLLVDEQ